MSDSSTAPTRPSREHLRADCGACTALCCVVPAFAASADFAIDKPAGRACPNLLADHRCGIHDRLRSSGFGGCVVFDCFGAGQVATALAPPPEIVADVFGALRGLHEMLWHLAEAEVLTADGPAGSLRDAVADLRDRVGEAAGRDADGVARVDTTALHAEVGALLGRVSAVVRADSGGTGAATDAGRRSGAATSSRDGSGSNGTGPDHAGRDLLGADLLGADLRRTDLRRASLRGALLVGADLRGADLTRADLLGADLRGADVRGARLADALFLTVPQLEAAVGDTATTLPPSLARPARWTTEPADEDARPDRRPARRPRQR